MKYFLGIDPGGDGGIAVIADDHSVAVLSKGSESDAEVVRIIKEFHNDWSPCFAVVERVASRPGQGAVSTFTFGKRYGVARGALLALGIPFQDSPAVTWNKIMGLSQPKMAGAKDEDEKDKRKRLSGRRKRQKELNMALAQQLFPNTPVTEKAADGLLLAEVARRIYNGMA